MQAQAGGQAKFSNQFLKSCSAASGGKTLNCKEETCGTGELLPLQD